MCVQMLRTWHEDAFNALVARSRMSSLSADPPLLTRLIRMWRTGPLSTACKNLLACSSDRSLSTRSKAAAATQKNGPGTVVLVAIGTRVMQPYNSSFVSRFDKSQRLHLQQQTTATTAAITVMPKESASKRPRQTPEAVCAARTALSSHLLTHTSCRRGLKRR